MATSEQITAKVNAQADPAGYEYKLWLSARYLVAQKAASPEYTDTKDGYYKGHHVIPGPKADPTLSPKLKEQDWSIIKHKHYIRFVDVKTTQNATNDIGRAIYTRMDNAQADEYEKKLRDLRNGGKKSKGVSSSAAK